MINQGSLKTPHSTHRTEERGDMQMRYDPRFKSMGSKELEKIPLSELKPGRAYAIDDWNEWWPVQIVKAWPSPAEVRVGIRQGAGYWEETFKGDEDVTLYQEGVI
jgi:hypothetical protein